MMYRIENSWSPEPAPAGTLAVTLHNLSWLPLADFTLSYTAITRVMPDAPQPENASLLCRDANYHRFAPPEGEVIAPGGSWTFRASGLNRSPFHRGDGVKTAYVTLADGTHVDCAVGSLALGSHRPEEPPARLPEGRLPEGHLTEPFALLPWPEHLELEAGETPVALVPAEGAEPEDVDALAEAGDLHARLFPAARAAVSLSPVPGGRPVAFDAADLAPAAYRLTFGPTVLLESSDPDGRRHGLTALLHLLHGATTEPATFRFPATGTIADAPRYDWRGCHLDVSRHFWPATDVCRFLDILAWYRMNVFHWHLTDDEGWRFEVPGLPTLTTVGATRGADGPLLPQLGDPSATRTQFYTTAELEAVVAHAESLGIEVVPEVDIPGHSTAMLAALPRLVDPDEPPASYHSVQGYPNNALNPAIEATYDALALVFDALVATFPSHRLHIGGDEVASTSWLASPLARALMEREGLRDTFELQSYFMKRVKDMLTDRSRVLVGWNEVAHGGGVPPEGTLLMAWENPQVGAALAREGYDVIITPGQAYYLDMAQSPHWLEPGAGWAGSSTPEQSYAYDAEASFPPDLRDRFAGIQACIWSEHFHTKAYFNDLVFPRLAAVAETAWTPPERKDWLRFAVQARGNPSL